MRSGGIWWGALVPLGGWGWGRDDAVLTHVSPTSEACSSNPGCGNLYGKLVVVYQWSAILHYRTLTNCIYWFPLPIKLPIVIKSK